MSDSRSGRQAEQRSFAGDVHEHGAPVRAMHRAQFSSTQPHTRHLPTAEQDGVAESDRVSAGLVRGPFLPPAGFAFRDLDSFSAFASRKSLLRSTPNAFQNAISSLLIEPE